LDWECLAEGRTSDFVIFEHHRRQLFGIAYRMLGTVDDAEDVVQDAYLRWHQTDTSDIRAPAGWLVSVVTRLCIDRLRHLAAERAAYAGQWLPEPIATDRASAPDASSDLTSDLSMAFLLLLERLSPDERAAFLLREVFDTEYDEIARVLDRTEAAVRQIVHRARERVRGGRARFAVPLGATPDVLDRFLAALANDDQSAVLALVSDDATYTGDGGGKISATRRVVTGASRVARLVLGFERKGRGFLQHSVEWLNGEPAIVTRSAAGVFYVTLIATDGERITAFYRVLNPDKLRHVDRAAVPAIA
jgi:RNA polymerase sigma-70 factor (ECF subfamily)